MRLEIGSTRTRYLFTALIGVLFPLAVSAQTSEFSSEGFLYQKTSPAENRNPDLVRAELSALQEELGRLEASYDVYDPAIAEITLDIGDRLRERELYDEAIVTYRRALHVTRINEGLLSERQVPILERIINTHNLNRDIEASGETLDRLTDVYFDIYEDSDVALIPHLISRGTWYISAFYGADRQRDVQLLMHAHEAYDRARIISESNDLAYQPDVYAALGAVNYNLAVLFAETGSTSSGNLLSDAERQGAFLGNSYRRGKLQLQKGLERAESSANPEHKLTALVMLGDWEQLFRKRYTARDIYLRADALAQEINPSDSSVTATQYFVQPSALPTFDRSAFLLKAKTTRDTVPVEVTMEVSAWGLPRNVSLTPESQELDNLRAKRGALTRAKSAVYRPKISNGQLTSSEQIKFVFRMPI